MVSRKLLVVAFVVLFVGVFGDDSSSTASSDSEGSKRHHPKELSRGGSFKKHVLSPEKFKAILEIYETDGSLEEKNKKVDELTQKYSEEEKKAVEGIKKHAAKRAEIIAKLSDDSKAVLKEIRGLKKQEHEALKKVDKKDLPIVLALLSHHQPSRRPSFSPNGKREHKSTGSTSGDISATEASAHA
uniref:DUF148 domain-containing protein n=1 Tax=Panagrolaimus davidi TaxID=227884 RepID=A0A914PA98_9BILA